MRLLVITNLFHPDRGGGGSVFTDLCHGLKERGWDVRVFTTYPYYPEWQRKSSESVWRITEECVQGLRVYRHGLFLPRNPSRLVPRVLFEMSFGLSLSRSLFRGGTFDAVMVFCPMLSEVLFAAMRCLLTREPLWLNVQDIPAEAAAASGISRSGVFNRLASWLQRQVFNRADVWSTISPVMADRLRPAQRRGQQLHLCPNWLNGSLADHVAGLPSKLARPVSHPLRLLYAGNIGKKQGLLEFCQQLSKCEVPFHFRIHGNGGEAGSIREWVVTGGDRRFEFGEFLDEAGFAKALHDTDIFVITEKSGSGASFIPSKLIPGIASGTPVLAICDRSGPLGREMREAGLGPILEWSETSQIANTLRGIAHDTDKFVGWQRHCLEHARTYHRDHAIGRMDDLIRQLIQQRTKRLVPDRGSLNHG
jgi:colanic acid biosynthesis glycosyl transferase WcaI